MSRHGHRLIEKDGDNNWVRKANGDIVKVEVCVLRSLDWDEEQLLAMAAA